MLEKRDALRRFCSYLVGNARRQLYNKLGVVGLDFCLVRCLVAHERAASVASVRDDISALRVGLCFDGAENTAARVRSVARIYVHVKRAEAEWTVVSRGVAEGKHRLSAVLADEAAIVFCKSFIFHK